MQPIADGVRRPAQRMQIATIEKRNAFVEAQAFTVNGFR